MILFYQNLQIDLLLKTLAKNHNNVRLENL